MSAQQTNNLLKVVTPQEIGVADVKPMRPEAFALWVRKLLQNWRQGTLGVQGRADVSFSNKKPWKQKGTGRARAGSARSPLWRGGGVIHGPQPRTRKLSISKQLRAGVFRDLFAQNAAAGNIVVANWNLTSEKPRTKEAYEFLKNAGLLAKKITLFVRFEDRLTFSSFINIPNVQILCFDQPNAFDLTLCSTWVVLNKDFDLLKEMVKQWQ